MEKEPDAAVGTSHRRDAAEIQQWLVRQVAEALEISPDEIEVDRPVQSYGVDSMQAVTIIAGLEDWLHIRFESNPLEDHPTIESLARFAADPVDGPPSVS